MENNNPLMIAITIHLACRDYLLFKSQSFQQEKILHETQGCFAFLTKLMNLHLGKQKKKNYPEQKQRIADGFPLKI